MLCTSVAQASHLSPPLSGQTPTQSESPGGGQFGGGRGARLLPPGLVWLAHQSEELLCLDVVIFQVCFFWKLQERALEMSTAPCSGQAETLQAGLL